MSKKALVLMGVSLLSFTGFLDATIVSTALPAIEGGLHMSVTQLQWVMNAFFLGISAFMASMGKVADIYGRRRVFYWGTIIFGIASLGAGLSTQAGWLITFRAIQGIMTAITIPVGIALIQTVYDKKELAKAMSIFATITGAGLALGPVVGGALVSVWGWPAVFFVNIPFVLLGFGLCLPSVKESRSATAMHLDYWGIVFLVLTTASLVFAVVEANNFGWGSPIILGSLAVFIVSLLIFIAVEAKVSDPIMSGALFRNRIFLASMLFSFAGGGLMSVILFINPLYLHLILEKSTWLTGVLLFIIPIVVVLSSPVFGHINHRIGCRPLLIVGAIFYLLTAIGHMLFTSEMNMVLLVATFVIFGFGWAIVNQVPAVALGHAIEPDHISVAMGALFSFYNIGAAVVLAASVSLFHWGTSHRLEQILSQQQITLNPTQSATLDQFVRQPDQLQTVAQQLPSPDILTILKNAFMSGMHSMFWPLLLISLIALWAVVFVMREKQA